MATEHAERQATALVDFISDFSRENGYSPSVEQMAQHMNMSKTGVRMYLNRLQEAGKISRPAGVKRGIRVV